MLAVNEGWEEVKKKIGPSAIKMVKEHLKEQMLYVCIFSDV